MGGRSGNITPYRNKGWKGAIKETYTEEKDGVKIIRTRWKYRKHKPKTQ